MRIRDLAGIEPAEKSVLAELGIHNTAQFTEAAATAYKRERLSGKTGIPRDRVRQLAYTADLQQQINGLGPSWVLCLNLMGVRTLKQLARYEPLPLRVKLARVQRSHGLGPPQGPPNVGYLRAWIDAAREAAPVVKA